MKTIRSFMFDTERYLFDFKLCPLDKGWAQLDTVQDASYFGNWVNPFTRETCNYAEGDVTMEKCDTDQEFVAWVLFSINCYLLYDPTDKIGIDPGFNKDLKAKFIELGLGGWLH